MHCNFVTNRFEPQLSFCQFKSCNFAVYVILLSFFVFFVVVSLHKFQHIGVDHGHFWKLYFWINTFPYLCCVKLNGQKSILHNFFWAVCIKYLVTLGIACCILFGPQFSTHHKVIKSVFSNVCVCMHVCRHACVCVWRACMNVCVCVCVRVFVCVCFREMEAVYVF